MSNEQQTIDDRRVRALMRRALEHLGTVEVNQLKEMARRADLGAMLEDELTCLSHDRQDTEITRKESHG